MFSKTIQKNLWEIYSGIFEVYWIIIPVSFPRFITPAISERSREVSEGQTGCTNHNLRRPCVQQILVESTCDQKEIA
jgi:hypothetical protein